MIGVRSVEEEGESIVGVFRGILMLFIDRENSRKEFFFFNDFI